MNGKKVLKTKWGTAKLCGDGYYKITSWKEGNNGANLHRLIFVDAYGPIPEDYIVHHKDHVKTNNSLENLMLISRSEHNSLHNKGKKYSEETIQKMRESSKGKITGNKNPNAKYNLWNNTKVHYHKFGMFKYNREPNPCKCFRLKYDGKDVNIGGFIDFITPTIIHDFIKECDNN